MSCCGQKRAQQRVLSSAFVHESKAPRVSAGRFPMGTAYFEYVGSSAMTAVGGFTNRQYRFAAPGVPVAVDARDRWSLARIHLLREIR